MTLPLDRIQKDVIEAVQWYAFFIKSQGHSQGNVKSNL